MESKHQELLNQPKPQLGKPTQRQCFNKSGVCRYIRLLLSTSVPQALRPAMLLSGPIGSFGVAAGPAAGFRCLHEADLYSLESGIEEVRLNWYEGSEV